MHGLEEASASQVRQSSRVVAIGLVGRQRLERLVGLPAFHADHGQTELAQPVKEDRRHASGLEDNSATTRSFRQFEGELPLPSTPTCSRKPSPLRDRERKHASRPSRYRGQQNSPSNGLLFRIVADSIGLCGRAPAHYPMLKNSA